jgi:hypothetical protein
VIEGFKLDSDFLAHIKYNFYFAVLVFIGREAVSALFDDSLGLGCGNLCIVVECHGAGGTS